MCIILRTSERTFINKVLTTRDIFVVFHMWDNSCKRCCIWKVLFYVSKVLSKFMSTNPLNFLLYDWYLIISSDLVIIGVFIIHSTM
jgi:hypothetical protein